MITRLQARKKVLMICLSISHYRMKIPLSLLVDEVRLLRRRYLSFLGALMVRVLLVSNRRGLLSLSMLEHDYLRVLLSFSMLEGYHQKSHWRETRFRHTADRQGLRMKIYREVFLQADIPEIIILNEMTTNQISSLNFQSMM